MKQETIEEAAERFYREYPNNPLDKPEWHFNKDINCFRKRKAFIAGAKWQQESMFEIMDSYVDDVMGGCNLRAKDWFQEFKNKL